MGMGKGMGMGMGMGMGTDGGFGSLGPLGALGGLGGASGGLGSIAGLMEGMGGSTGVANLLTTLCGMQPKTARTLANVLSGGLKAAQVISAVSGWLARNKQTVILGLTALWVIVALLEGGAKLFGWR